MITRDFVSSLWCVTCRSAGLRVIEVGVEGGCIRSGRLECTACSAVYEIRNGVPCLIPEPVVGSSEWRVWKEHLAGFEARRNRRLRNASTLGSKYTNRSHGLHRTFSEFVNLRKGALLDIGCGTGNFRRRLKPEVRYVGVDPMPLPETNDFLFAQAVAEVLPFKDDSFLAVIVISALDHFRNPDGVLREASRVLAPHGRLHVVQSVHEVRGPISGARMAAHWAKELLESCATRGRYDAAPRHMTEFTTDSARELLGRRFEIVAERRFSRHWFSPEILLLSMAPR